MNEEKLKYYLYLEIQKSGITEPIPYLTYNKCLMSKSVVKCEV